jgi:hypothetical protein
MKKIVVDNYPMRYLKIQREYITVLSLIKKTYTLNKYALHTLRHDWICPKELMIFSI